MIRNALNQTIATITAAGTKTKHATITANTTTLVEIPEALTGNQFIKADYTIVGDGVTQYGAFKLALNSATGEYELFEELNKIDSSGELLNQQVSLLQTCILVSGKVNIQVQSTLGTNSTIDIFYNIY